MRLIKSVTIDHFRSIQHPQTVEMDHFTVIAGLNNAGKSNLLRALNLFFTGTTDVGVRFDYSSDYNQHDLRSRKKSKDILITVAFELPENFKFRIKLEAVKELLGRKFEVTKAWSRNSTTPIYRLNNEKLGLEDMAKVDQFLALINFRYIPNRVLPLDIIRNEHDALRDAIVRRLSKRLGKQDKLFSTLKQTSEKLVEGMQEDFKLYARVDSVRLDMPTSWHDFVFALGYKITNAGIEVDDSVQGSGVQSLLMLQTLAFIDKDYFQRFGWRQAAIWAIEEPESSMHTSLEARVASYLSQLATEPDGRLQILGTTHSDLMLQASKTIVMAGMEKGRTHFKKVDKRKGLLQFAKDGVSRFAHPLLSDPLHPMILVEGKYDYAFLQQAIRLLAPNSDIQVSFLEDMDNSGGQTGGTNLQPYLKSHQLLLSMRMEEAPILVLLDWDAEKKVKEFEKYCDDRNRYQVKAWQPSSYNPTLNNKFKGIERHMSDRIIDEANSNGSVLGKTASGVWSFSPEDYNKEFKPAVYKVVQKGITIKDLTHVKKFIVDIISTIERKD